MSGLKGSDTVTGRTESYSDKNAGTGKTLIVNSGYVVNDGNGGNNYSVMLVNNATGVINPAPLTGQANNATNVYGHALPSLTVTYSGFVGGDTLASLSGALSCVTSAAAWSPVSGNPYSITCSGQSSINYTITYLPGTLTVTQATTSVSVASSANPSILNASVTFTATVSPQYSGVPTGTVTFKDGSNTIGTGTLNGSGIATYTTSALGAGSHSITASYAGDGNFTGNSGSMTQSVQYLSGGTCAGDAGHQILQPINTDGSSVWKQGSTVPAKFRVCDVNGVSIGTTGVIAGFVLYRINSGTIAPVDETTDNSTNDLGWHFDSTAQQWIFNMSTKTAPQNVANRTYYYQITLNDGSTILFDFGLK